MTEEDFHKMSEGQLHYMVETQSPGSPIRISALSELRRRQKIIDDNSENRDKRIEVWVVLSLILGFISIICTISQCSHYFSPHP